jgi:Tfp pilus assembly protein PilN
MIELFDANRLLPQRDRSLLLAGGALGLGLVGLTAHAVYLEQQITHAQAEGRGAQTELKQLKAITPPPGPALLADLEQQALRLETELAAAGGSPGGPNGANPKPSQWLERLDAMASAEIGLSLVEIDRNGSARIEGMARTPQAMSSYVQAWEHQQAQAPMRARGIEVRQDEKSAPLLRFQLRANLPGPKP